MFGGLHIVLSFAHSIALIAVLAVAYGTIRRHMGSLRRANLVLGLLFGLSAVLAMFDPVEFAPGVFVDMRAVPMALAGGYLGPAGAAVALCISAVARLWIGGAGAVSGVAGLALATLAGLVWARFVGRKGRIRLPQIALLGVMSSFGLAGLVLLPWAMAVEILLSLGPIIMAMNAVGVILCASVVEREKRLMQTEVRLREDGMTDALTGLLNRRGFEAAQGIRAIQKRSELGQGLLLLDIDHFKSINDRFGHASGDEVLRQVAECLHGAMRADDHLGRIGGEEFAVDLYTRTEAQALAVADMLRREVAALSIALTGQPEVRVSVSIGLHWARHPVSLTKALSAADAALYAAKRAGRDQVAVAA